MDDLQRPRFIRKSRKNGRPQYKKKEQVRIKRKAGKKCYYTGFDLYVGQYSEQHLIMSSNVS